MELYREETGEYIGAVRVEGSGDQTLLALLKEQGIILDAPCNGKGSCGRCRVRYESGAPEPAGKERRILTERELERGIRPACASVPREESRIALFTDRTERIRALAGASVPREERAPGPASISVPREKSAPGPASISVPREESAPGTVCTCDTAGGLCEYGIAVDIGTTTIAMSLVVSAAGGEEPDTDCAPSGGRHRDPVRLAAVTSVNHQRMYGADVIARIQAANEGKGEALRQLVCSDLARMAKELLRTAGVPAARVKRMAVAGNTTMCHLLRGLSCATLGTAPFTAVDLGLWRGRCADLPGMEWLPAECVILPGISVFAGADLVAGMYAGRLEEAADPVLFLDIGTNGEMAVGGREGVLVTSAAAGPVFEGGGISCGMPGIPGAVTHVRIWREPGQTDPGTVRQCAQTGGAEETGMRRKDGCWESVAGGYRIRCETIGEEEPAGLCGTGIIDAVSGLVRAGLIDENGTLAEPWCTTGFPVAGDQIRLTQQDIRQVQMGKAAIRAGIETLLEEYRAMEGGRGRHGDTDRQPRTAGPLVWLAGGFGYDMEIESAVAIGLFPKSFLGKVTAVGNSALRGAERFLAEAAGETGESAGSAGETGESAVSAGKTAAEAVTAGRAAEWIAGHAGEISLALHQGFADRYVSHMFFAAGETE